MSRTSDLPTLLTLCSLTKLHPIFADHITIGIIVGFSTTNAEISPDDVMEFVYESMKGSNDLSYKWWQMRLTYRALLYSD